MQAEAVAGSRQSAINAKRAWAKGRGLISNAQIASGENSAILGGLTKRSMANANYRNMRSKVEAAARSSYSQIKAELMAIKDEDSCPSMTNADVEFLAFAISEIMTEEQIEMISENTGAAGGWRNASGGSGGSGGSQGGGARFKQKGGALGAAIANFFRSLCGRASAYRNTANQVSAANVDAVARAIDNTSHGDITRNLIVGMSSAGALGTMLTGQNGMATLALTALNIVRSILPTPGEVLANAYSGIVAWGPVGAALVPVLGNLAIIYACFIAIKETNAFVLSGSREGLVFLTNADYKGFLVQLSKRIFDVLMRSATGSIQARMNRNAGVRRTVAAAAAAAPVRAIEAAVDAALAQPGLAPVFQAATATASGTGLSAAGGGAAGPLPTITEEQAEEAADAATVAGEEAERQSQAAGEGPQGGAAAAAEEENSQAAGFEGMNLPQGNQAERNAFNFNTRTTSTRMGVPVNRSGGVAGPASGALGATPAALAMAAAPAPVAAPSGRGTKRTLTAAAAAAPGGGGRGAASKRGKGGKSRKQHGGRRNQKKTRKNRK